VTDNSTVLLNRAPGSSLSDAGTRIVGQLRFQMPRAEDTSSQASPETTIGLPQEVIARPEALSRLVVLATENKLLQLWEGHVTSVAKGEFTAVIRDRTVPSNPDEEVTISIDELGTEDGGLVRPGAVFYWSVRYEQEIGLARRRVSRIRFRRLPGWSRSEVMEADSFVQNIRHMWTDDAPDGTSA
jgi:hypothetical protein